MTASLAILTAAVAPRFPSLSGVLSLKGSRRSRRGAWGSRQRFRRRNDVLRSLLAHRKTGENEQARRTISTPRGCVQNGIVAERDCLGSFSNPFILPHRVHCRLNKVALSAIIVRSVTVELFQKSSDSGLIHAPGSGFGIAGNGAQEVDVVLYLVTHSVRVVILQFKHSLRDRRFTLRSAIQITL